MKVVAEVAVSARHLFGEGQVVGLRGSSFRFLWWGEGCICVSVCVHGGPCWPLCVFFFGCSYIRVCLFVTRREWTSQ